MPRKARPGMLLIIEGLSDGKRGLVDDFTGQVIPEPSAKARDSVSVMLNQRNLDKLAAQRAILVKAGMLPGELVVYVPPGRGLTKIITDRNGDQFTITSPKRPFRRI